MPIQDKDLGRYKRPGIFINEIDNSIVELPVQNVLINLVPGFSKKGPVNRPVYVTNQSDFNKIFGDIDRGLERKGSYFHRTCIKMLQTGPIWALNLLITNDLRDKLAWKSISCGSAFENDITRLMPYSRVFNRQDFWDRDDESFLDFVNDYNNDNRLLHITNMGERTITVFTYKSTISGFDVTAENWYGGTSKVPSYIHPKDWMSDYIISVLVLEGDWTDYETLTVDTTWGKYFTNVGLDKNTVQDFVNESNVTTLAYYDVSLLPYFKDVNGRDMYIKTVINNNTDKTGLFCAYNEDALLDSDYPTGKVDLVGDGIVGLETPSVDFLSYNESIIESLTYSNTYLDNDGNVFGNYSTSLSDTFASKVSRTASNTNWYISNTKLSGSTLGVSASDVRTTLYLINGIKNSSATGGTLKTWFYLPQLTNPATTYQNTYPYVAKYHQPFSSPSSLGDKIFLSRSIGGLSANTVYYINDETDGGRWFALSEIEGGSPIVIDDTLSVSDLYIQRSYAEISTSTLSTFNLGGSQYHFNTGTTKIVFDPLVITQNLSNDSTHNRYDVLYVTPEDQATVKILTGVQAIGTTAIKPNFTVDYAEAIILGYVHHSIQSGCTPTLLTSAYTWTNFAIKSEYTPVTLGVNGYLTLQDITISGYTSNGKNYLKMNFGNTSGYLDLKDYTKIRYRAVYDEFEANLQNNQSVIINSVTGHKHYIMNPQTIQYSNASNAWVSFELSSGIYTDYYSTGSPYAWLLYYVDNEFVVGTHTVDRLLTTLSPVEDLLGYGQSASTYAGVIGRYSNIYLAYFNGDINNGNYGYEYNMTGSTGSVTKIYLKTWIQDTDVLYIDFVSDLDGISPQPIKNWATCSSLGYCSKFTIWSNKSHYKQSLEIEWLDESKLVSNIIYEIKVDKTRYSEVKKGNFIEAYYDETALGDPKKLARIISTSIDSTNSNWKIIKTDVPMKITKYLKNGSTTEYDYQTMVYPQIDIYVSTYKGIKLTPFTISADSMPTGTDGSQEREVRQSSILDIMGKTTNLAKGLVNKNKISWRYLVDSFGNGLTSLSKQQYADLCAMKLNCLAFVNAPSVKQFKASASPSFINESDSTLNTAYLKAGGNEDLNPAFLYSFAEGQGRSCMGYFFPYVRINDNGIPKNVPPAAWIATTYMQKHISSSASIVPWTIAAGISNGRVTDIGGVEMDFTDEDLENLYGMNLNPIVKKRNTGYCINSESTAQVFPYSSLSVIHSREVLIELENSLYDMLLRYQWRFNTPEIRGEIKYRADKICKDLQDRNALYNFKNVIDETNNTNYIIDLQMGVLDTFIEIIKGMGIIVNNITILKKGDIESGGFQ